MPHGVYTIYIQFTSQFWAGFDRRKVQPVSYFFTIQTLVLRRHCKFKLGFVQPVRFYARELAS